MKEGKNLMGFGAFKNIDDGPPWLQYNVMTVRLGAAVWLLCWSLRWRKSSEWVLRFLKDSNYADDAFLSSYV